MIRKWKQYFYKQKNGKKYFYKQKNGKQYFYVRKMLVFFIKPTSNSILLKNKTSVFNLKKKVLKTKNNKIVFKKANIFILRKYFRKQITN